VLGPRGENITIAVQAAFQRLKPVCGGDKAVAAVRAVNEVVTGQRMEERQ
jgi:hypothetical protein